MSKAIWSGKMANFKNHLQNFKQTLKYNNNYHINDMAAVQEASMTIFNIFFNQSNNCSDDTTHFS